MTQRTYLPEALTSSGVLQRKCACGKSVDGSGECEECRKKRNLQRKAAGSGERATVPPIVHEVLRSPGQPLDATTRTLRTASGVTSARCQSEVSPKAALIL
jgi:hypothetical protein